MTLNLGSAFKKKPKVNVSRSMMHVAECWPQGKLNHEVIGAGFSSNPDLVIAQREANKIQDGCLCYRLILISFLAGDNLKYVLILFLFTQKTKLAHFAPLS